MFDWNGTYTEEAFNEEFTPLTFKGPGIYTTDTDTILVLPDPRKAVRGGVVQDEIVYPIYVWNAPLQDTTLDFIAKAPLHADLRTAAQPPVNEGTDA